jgi:hypothetical protein
MTDDDAPLTGARLGLLLDDLREWRDNDPLGKEQAGQLASALNELRARRSGRPYPAPTRFPQVLLVEAGRYRLWCGAKGKAAVLRRGWRYGETGDMYHLTTTIKGDTTTGCGRPVKPLGGLPGPAAWRTRDGRLYCSTICEVCGSNWALWAADQCVERLRGFPAEIVKIVRLWGPEEAERRKQR